MSKKCTSVAMLVCLAASVPALADVNTSGFKASVYAGGTSTSMTPGDLSLLGETDAIKPSDHQQTDFSWGVGAGYRFVHPSSIQPFKTIHDISLGLDFFDFNTTQSGNTWQFQDPTFNNFTYKTPIKSWRLLVDSEFTFQPVFTRIYPFLEGGIGFAANNASYQDTPIPDYGGTGPTVNGHTQYQFAYTAGGGLKALVSPHVELSFRYLYAHLGDATTSPTANLPLTAPVSVALYTHAWLAGLTYLF